MNRKLQAKLYKKFPNLYRDRNKTIYESCMAWGIETGDGWYQLIHDLSVTLEKHGVIAVQVKEKFGGLRFYCDYPHHLTSEQETLIHDLKDKYEDLSEMTCEFCGAPGEMTGTGWIKTLCKKCDEETK